VKGLTSAAALLTLAASLIASPAAAQMTGAPTPGYLQAPGAPAQSMPQPLREIGFDQNIDQKLPLDAQFRDEDGKTVSLGSFYGKRPVLLGFVYFTCPMLCTQVLNAMTATISTLSLDAGKDFDVVLISFDPRETPAQAAAKKAEYLHRYKRQDDNAGWHFLTGDEAEIKRVTKAAGFRYAWDEQTQQFAHPTGIIITTTDTGTDTGMTTPMTMGTATDTTITFPPAERTIVAHRASVCPVFRTSSTISTFFPTSCCR